MPPGVIARRYCLRMLIRHATPADVPADDAVEDQIAEWNATRGNSWFDPATAEADSTYAGMRLGMEHDIPMSQEIPLPLGQLTTINIEVTAADGVTQKVTAGQAHWQAGVIERHGGILEQGGK